MAKDGDAEKYTFRYKFQPGDVLQWEVIAQVSQLTTKGSHRENSETISISTKVWKVLEVEANGSAVLEYCIRDVNMGSQSTYGTNVEERKFNSKTDETPPIEFLDVAELIGQPIAHFTINTQGEIIKRSQKAKVAVTMQFAETAEENRITIPMPEYAICVGDTWDYSREIIIPQANGTVKKVSVRECYTLEKVQNGVATFGFKTHVITPLHNDKETDWALRTKIRNGTILFDMIEGRSVSQQYDVKKTAIELGSLARSSASYQSRFAEKYLRDETKTASGK
jgi:hypothetical protein